MKLELIVKKWNGKKKKGVKKKFPKYPPFPEHKLKHKCVFCKSKFKSQVIGGWNPDIGSVCLKCVRKGVLVRNRKKKRKIKFAMD